MVLIESEAFSQNLGPFLINLIKSLFLKALIPLLKINDIIESSRRVVTEIANQNAELAARAKFSLDTAMMTDTERANAQALFDIEQQRLVLLKQIALS